MLPHVLLPDHSDQPSQPPAAAVAVVLQTHQVSYTGVQATHPGLNPQAATQLAADRPQTGQRDSLTPLKPLRKTNAHNHTHTDTHS
jgi:hypothetical protein